MIERLTIQVYSLVFRTTANDPVLVNAATTGDPFESYLLDELICLAKGYLISEFIAQEGLDKTRM